MPQPGFTGEVRIRIFFGTKYDDVNVPYYSSQIINEASKTIDMNGQVVWQTTWISAIDINTYDYQDIVGAQYVAITDTGTSNHGLHWFDVLAYTQLSKKCTRLSIRYNPLLSIGIGNIAKISGVIQRWTVADDEPFKYSRSPEPIDQIDDYVYSYWRKKCDTGGVLGIIGFPYDMLQAPEILNYRDRNGNYTNIYYPKLETVDVGTTFMPSTGGDTTFRDGLRYYYMWGGTGFGNVRENYDYAVGLGYDLVSNAYTIPLSDLIEITAGDQFIAQIAGKSQNVPTGFSLYAVEQLNNQKAKDIGNIFTLYNEVSGESVTISAEDISDTSIDLSCNPYITGYFGARFHSYMHDVNGYSGVVRSVGWQPATLSSRTAASSSLARLDRVMQTDSLLTEVSSGVNAIAAQRQNINDTADYNAVAAGVRGTSNMIGSALSLNVGGVINSAVDTGLSLAGTALQQNNALRTAEVEEQRLLNNRDRQMEALYAKGTLGQNRPPAVKFNNDYNFTANAYTFCVRKTSLSTFDRQRADRFFTAYGYNVNNETLNSPDQLHCRQRFTFIMADNVEIEALVLSSDITRIRDFATVREIQSRFSAGLRIWVTTPDYDFSKANPTL